MKHWNPPPNVTTHAGERIEPGTSFPIPPPPAIGEVITAFSNVLGGKGYMTVTTRLIIATVLALVVTVLSLVLVHFSFPNTDEMFELGVISLVLGMIAGIAAFFVTKTRRNISYVGQLGLARYTFHGSSDDHKSEVLLFDDAVGLTTEQTEMHQNGIYTGTSYKYVWKDARGVVLLKLKGNFRAKGDQCVKPRDPFHLANIAELIYTDRVMMRMDKELQQNGFVEFRVNSNDIIRISPNVIDITFRGQNTRVGLEHLATCRIDKGMFLIETVNASWFGGGKFRFNYSKMSNARAFVLGLEEIVGIQMT